MKKYLPLLLLLCLLTGRATAQTQQPLHAVISSKTNIPCHGDGTGSAIVSVSGGVMPYTYLWVPVGETTDTANYLTAGTYTVIVTDSISDTAYAHVTIAEPPLLVTISRTLKDVSCFGMANGKAVTEASGGQTPYQYLWQPVGSTTDTATGLPAATFTSIVTDAGGCIRKDTTRVYEPAALSLTAAAVDSTAYAVVTGGTLPYTFSWTPPVSTTALARGLAPGTYTVTVNDSNLCSNTIMVVVPSVDLGIFIPPTAGVTETCVNGSPGYFSFPIMISQLDSAYHFNSCVVDLEIGREYVGDSVSNGGVTVYRGAQFQPAPGNDYGIFNVVNLSDTVIQIQLGSPTDSSPNGTIVPIATSSGPGDTMTLFTVQLKIQNCIVSSVGFIYDSSTAFLSYYTVLDSIPNGTRPDTMAVFVCDSCGHYACSSSDGTFTLDSLCCCIDSFTYAYGIDTVYAYFYRNKEYLTGYGGVANTSQRTQCWPYITNTMPISIDAGTNEKSVPPNSSIFTINGYNFGRKKGWIEVANADSGYNGSGGQGWIPLDSTDILSWTNEKIIVKMPSVLLGSSGTPGSGEFHVRDACYYYASGNLQINYSILNQAYSPAMKARPNMVMVNSTESFNFVCDTSISRNPKAFGCVKKAIREWNCYTGVNWKLSSDTNVFLDTILQDGISGIYFCNHDFAPTGALMATKPQILPDCPTTLSDSITFYDEADIEIKRDGYLPYGLHWDYDTTGAFDTGAIAYFYDDILHELGHAHGLKHINDVFSLMYYMKEPNFRPDITTLLAYPGPATLMGGLDMVHTSTANSPSVLGCSLYNILVPDIIGCIDSTLSVPIVSQNPYNLALYPSPINSGDITIAYELLIDSHIQFKITDCIGRVLIVLPQIQEASGKYSKEININNFAEGVYFFVADINGEHKIIKFIKI